MNIAGASNILRVSRRTVARALSNEYNGYLNPRECYTNSDELSLVYDCDPAIFKKAYDGDRKHKLLKPDEAIAYLGIPARTFRYKQKCGKIKPVLKNGRVVRFTEDYLDGLIDIYD